MTDAAAGRPAVFLDRDGVITVPVVSDGRERPPRSLDELAIVPGAADATAALHEAGFVLLVVTNQPDVARGGVARGAVDEINERVAATLGLDGVYVCPHDGADRCDCRKPRPGMVLRGAADHGIDLGASWLVGDRWVDIAAGRAAGVRTVLVERPGSFAPTSAGSPPEDLVADVVVEDVVAAAQAIIRSR